MDKYYYVVSQLPLLYFGKKPDITIQNFLEESKKWLSAKDYRILARTNINDIKSEIRRPEVLRMYQNFEHQLREDIALWRQAQKKDVEYKPTGFPLSVIKEGNPLEIEVKLMQLRWAFIDELHREHHFDLGMLVLYHLKLQILQRYFTFNKEEGLKKFQKLYEVNI